MVEWIELVVQYSKDRAVVVGRDEDNRLGGTIAISKYLKSTIHILNS